MEEHFLRDAVEGEPGFQAEPWYNPHGDCISYQLANEAVVGDRIDEVLTIYRSALDNRPIGYQVKGVAAIIRRFGFDGLACSSTNDDGGLVSVSVGAILLAAYEDGPRTMNRRMAYATVMGTTPEHGIRRDELVPV